MSDKVTYFRVTDVITRTVVQTASSLTAAILCAKHNSSRLNHQMLLEEINVETIYRGEYISGVEYKRSTALGTQIATES